MTLFERGSALARIDESVRRAAAGHGRVAVVVGPLGIGKSALLKEIGARVADVGGVALWASAASAEREFPHGVVRQVLEPALSAADGGPSAEPDLHRLLSSGSPHLVSHELRSAVRDLSRERLVALLVDDVQWADPQSLDWLAYLSRRLGALRVLVVVTLLDDGTGPEIPAVREVVRAAEVVVRLPPLSPPGVLAYLVQRLGIPVDEETASVYHLRSGGNPTVLGVLVADLQDEHTRGRRLIDLSVIVGRCLRQQPERVGALARALAVLEEPATPEMLGRLAELDEVDVAEAVRALRALGLLDTGPPLRFAVSAVREAVRVSMPAQAAERLEGRAASVVYDGGGSVEQVAHHLVATTSPAGDWALEILQVAATAALSRGEATTAVRYLRRALLDTRSDGPDRGRLLSDLAAAELNHDVGSAVRHAHQALPLLGSVSERAATLCRTPIMLSPGGSAGIDLVRSIAAELGDPADLTGADREMALRMEARLRLTTQEDPVELLASVDRLHELGTDPALASSGERELYAVLLYAGMLTGRVAPDVLARLGNRVLAGEPGAGVQVHSALPVVVTTLVAVESVQNLDPWLRAAEEDAQRQKMLLARALVRARRAMVLCCVGDLARARDLAVETLSAADPLWLEVIASCAVTLATVAVELRDTALADGVMTRCLRSVEAFQMSTLLGMIRGSAAIAADNLPAAVEHFEDLSRHFDRIGWQNPTLFPVRARLVTLHARLGNTEMANELSERNLERTRGSGIAGPVGRALRLRGALTTGRQSVSFLRESVEALTASINRLELAKAQVLLGQRLREAGDDSADGYLREGHRNALSAGATWLVERASTLLGGRQAWRRPDGRATLTTTERRVVELVVGGHRNKEVADQLGVGSRAVEKHLTSAYRKLGVVGRSDLADAMSAEDDVTGGSPQGFWAG